ncbi:probable cytosolic oligopeptidase A [Olea europaea subsp. europaea]|uniref:Probable cytosolic oligopeptidase A n=1 Tax=Olea europaea subsp. europaea TaxID=158383 RepID=A0A8S0TXR8_OLEEU|nr:probable cytosolic oligopeptidase A [Olea europaea subsp. europaea]
MLHLNASIVPQQVPHELSSVEKGVKLKEAVLDGVSLEDIERERFNQIQLELAKLSQKFEENIIDATKMFEKIITDKKEVEGITLIGLAVAAEKAVLKSYTFFSFTIWFVVFLGHCRDMQRPQLMMDVPWAITLGGPRYRAVLQHSCNRSLREEVYRGHVTRASDGTLNNNPVIERILELRLKKAKLLGYSNFAGVSMETKMATIDKAKDLLYKLHSASWNPATKGPEFPGASYC